MKRLLLACAALALVVAGCGGDASDTAGQERGGITVVVNADVYTMDPAMPSAEAFAYDEAGVITAVGTEESVVASAGDAAVVLDAEGAFVLPGFQDPHLHVPEAGLNGQVCFLRPGASLAAYARMVSRCAAEQPGTGWVRAAGASLFGLRGASPLPIEALDRVVPDRPVLVLDDLGHAAWTNSAGLDAAGISADAADPPGGIYERDPASGRLTGLLLENAQHRVRNAAAVDPDEVYEGLLSSLEELARNGITAVSDAGGYWTRGHVDAWKRALREDRLTVRARNALYVFPDRPLDEQLAELGALFDDGPSDLLRFNTAKIYVDGILDLGTAALLEPYEQPIDPRFPSGFLYFEAAALQTYVRELHEIGFQLHFHVIGDAATRAALDAVESISPGAADVADRRHRTTHTYLVHDDDVDRFAELGVVADFQMAPIVIDPDYARSLSPLIGDRAFGLVPTTRLLEAGAAVSLSSDWDADPLSPLGAIERAVRRAGGGIDLDTAIRLVTVGAAQALRTDAETGSITVGKQADFVLLDQNLFDVRPRRIDDTQVLMTVVGVRIVYDAGRGG